MKEANLESLAIAPADEVKHLLEGEGYCGSWCKDTVLMSASW
jgi:hypothetical protein